MILPIILWVVSGTCLGFALGGFFWEYHLGREYNRCIDDLLSCLRRQREELAKRENKTRVEGDEWKDS